MEQTKQEFLKEYYNILSPSGIPNFLEEYINTPEMQRIGKISMNCGADYTKIYNNKMFYSNLDHSIGVALIIWNFTKDKKQTLAGLFHDIATPTFKHCIDFMNGDYEKQESTEELTTKIIENSNEIMKLLKRDGIKVDEIDNYKKYPIADNETPKLSSDRFEYNFSGGFSLKDIWTLEEIKEVYDNVTVLKNENGIDELGFKDIEIAEKYIEKVSQLWPEWIINKDKTCMQFVADCVKTLYNQKEISKRDLYTLSEQEVINKIENSNNNNLSKYFKKYRMLTEVKESNEKPEGKYSVNIKTKRRYVNPLAKTETDNKRIYELSETAKRDIDNFLDYKMMKYGYLDFDSK